MKKSTWVWSAAVVVAAGAVAAFILLNNSLGNNVEIESVIPEQSANNSSTGAAGINTANAAAAPVTGDQLNGSWSITDASKVYWSVTTSKETVNFVDPSVDGSWEVNLEDAAAMNGEGTIDMTTLDSGNGQRDEHVKSGDFLDVAQFPQAEFMATSFSALPAEWTEGTAVPVEMKGTLTVKGIEKEVTFQSQAVYSAGQLMLSGTTVVTFADFGMTNPHSIVLDTENDLEVRLELVLDRQ
ncbi:YceI family protein [Paenibacillus sp. NFR01]|uniref:YceI family protein n=1 Tax=Paenibacillus sp. NFR01 TaxID=1566279 RepID=UPI0008CB3426|nr:YceI family protein [Paenibacillus sp. NFR01]SEU01998.1 Polyisoprenoid-binding protein YceI [Paenibacillus sp. NFR01]